MIGKEGLDLIKQFESLKLKAYKCPAGVWTIGYGSTYEVYEGMIITEQEADERLLEDVIEAESCIHKYVIVDLNQNQFDALVSFIFNLGCGNFKKSTLLKRINTENFEDVPYQLSRWNKAGGVVLNGLIKRRRAEGLLFEGKDWRS